MKVAVCYDNLCTKGGHERVILTLAREFKADIFTIKYDQKNTFPEFNDYNIYSNDLKYNILGFRLLEVIYTFRNLNLSDYDLIISNGGWSRQIAFNKKNHPVIDYNPGPPGFLKYENHSNRIFNKIWLNYIKKLDFQAANKVDCLIANSNYVKNIIDGFNNFKNDVEVVFPPINVKKFQNRNSENYFLSVQRITPDKRLDLQLEIFKKLTNENLVILGSIGNKDYFYHLLKNAPDNIEFITDVSDEKIIESYSRCKGVIQTGKGEPFGIVPIEAMASGKPCIAVNEGGYKETIINKKTGLLIDPPYWDNFVNIIQNFNNFSFNPQVCQERAMEFSEEVFIEKIKSIINSVME